MMKTLKYVLFFFFLLVSLCPLSIYAQSTSYRSDGGAFTRLYVGVGNQELIEERVIGVEKEYRDLSFLGGGYVGWFLNQGVFIHIGGDWIYTNNLRSVPENPGVRNNYSSAALFSGIGFYFTDNFYISPIYRYILSSTLIAKTDVAESDTAGTDEVMVKNRYSGHGFGVTGGWDWFPESTVSTGIIVSYYQSILSGKRRDDEQGTFSGETTSDPSAREQFVGISLVLTFW